MHAAEYDDDQNNYDYDNDELFDGFDDDEGDNNGPDYDDFEGILYDEQSDISGNNDFEEEDDDGGASDDDDELDVVKEDEIDDASDGPALPIKIEEAYNEAPVASDNENERNEAEKEEKLQEKRQRKRDKSGEICQKIVCQPKKMTKYGFNEEDVSDTSSSFDVAEIEEDDYNQTRIDENQAEDEFYNDNMFGNDPYEQDPYYL